MREETVRMMLVVLAKACSRLLRRVLCVGGFRGRVESTITLGTGGRDAWRLESRTVREDDEVHQE